MTYAIEVNNFNKVYDGFELKDVCFKLETGTIMAVSYTHLDVYKRQVMWKLEIRRFIWVEVIEMPLE